MFQNSSHLPTRRHQEAYQPLGSHSADYELSHLQRSQSPPQSVNSAWDNDEVNNVRSQAPLIPKDDAKPLSVSTVGNTKKARFSGWRVGVTWCAIATIMVLLINIIWTVVASIKYDVNNGLGIIQRGSCDEAKKLSLWLHFGINALSTTLLAASNYCMQCLASPTRAEVDAAHKRRKWLDIGVPSVRNLRYIARSRVILWMLLGVSGVPLHLLYNSAVFSSLNAQDYQVWAVSQEAMDAPDLAEILKNHGVQAQYEILSAAKDWDKLNVKDCAQAYAKQFVTTHSNLYLVSPYVNVSAAATIIQGSPYRFDDGTKRRFDSGNNGYDWMCKDYCPNIDQALEGARGQPWTIYKGVEPFLVNSCLSKSAKEHCSVQFSVVIMSIVIVANAVKALCMVSILQRHRGAPLVTIGDAVQSFLRDNDAETIERCLASGKNFDNTAWLMAKKPQPFRTVRHFWFAGASRTRWLSCNILCIITLAITGGLLAQGVIHLSDRSLAHIAALGFGGITAESLTDIIDSRSMSRGTALFLNILIANLPQPILSFLFLTYNSLYTCMLMVQEWYDYAYERKHLRVTDPTGRQRSTYRLQLPYKYGIPLVVLSGILHWLVSQTIFLVDIEIYRGDAMASDDRIIRVGYSCIAIITTIALGSFTIIAGILMGFRRYRGGMPLAGSCSAAISAACHQPSCDSDAAEKPLLWGVPEDNSIDQTNKGSIANAYVGHCCFTSLPALPLVEGQLYAGDSKLGSSGNEND